MKRKVLALLTALGFALGLATIVATPASAAAWDCPLQNGSGVAIIGCLYPDANGGGNPYLMGSAAGCHNLTGGWANLASSVENNSMAQGWGYEYNIVLWSNANCSGPSTLFESYYSSPYAPGPTKYNLPRYSTSLPGNNDAQSWAAYVCCGDPI